MFWIEANGASLRYELSGSGKETLVLVHEAGGCLESYEDALPGLEKEFRVLRYDQRGFGFSEKVRELSFESVVADMAGLLDALKITAPVHLAGCAMGADFSAGFAARHPERIAKLALAASFTAAARMMSAVDLTPEYAKIRAPTLVIGGRHDVQRPPEMAERVANAIRGAKYVLADTGHFINVETPQLFVDTVLPFLKDK
jgi:3-oxoadipate enol-lactonase